MRFQSLVRDSKAAKCRWSLLGPVLVDDPLISGGFTVWLTTDAANHLAGRYVSANDDVDELTAKKEEIVKNDLYKLRVTGLPPVPQFVQM